MTGITKLKDYGGSLNLFQTIAGHTRDIVLFMRLDNGQLIEANAAAEKSYGYTRQELLKLSIHDLRADETRAFIADQMSEADAHGILFETVHRSKDGSTFPVEVSSQGVTVDGERMLVSVVRDISERKSLEEKLRASQKDLNRAQAVAHIGNWRLNVRQNELLWSEEVYRIFSIPMGTPLTYEVFLSAVHPDDREYVDRSWSAALRGEPYDIEHRINTGDTVKWVRERAELEFDDQGNLLGGFGTVQDITDRKQIEKALRDSEERFRSAFDKGSVPMVMTGLDNRLMVVNSSFSQMLGYSVPELIGKSFYDFTHPDDFAVNKPGIDAVMKGEKDSFRMEKRYIRKDGRVIWVDMSTASVRDETGRPLHLVTYAQDITERKRAEEQIRRRENELRLVMDAVPALLSYVDAEFHYRRINKGYERWFGLKRQDIEGRHAREAIGEASWELVRPRMERAMAGETVSYEEYMPYAKGGARWVEATFVPDRDAAGRVQGIVALITDISARKQAEESVRESEQRFRSYFESPLVGKAISVPDKGIIEVNDQMCSIWGYSRDELVRMKWTDLTHPDDLAADIEQFNSLLAGEIDSYLLDKRYIRKDGKIVWTILAVGCVRGSDGKVKQLAASVLDITERKRAENALRESETRYRTLVDSAPFAIGIHRREQILYANKVALELLGAETLEQLQKKSMFDLIHPAYIEPVVERMRRLESGLSLTEEAEFELIRLDGRTVPVEVVAGMVICYEGAPAIQVTFRDITDRKQIESILQKSKDDLEIKVRERTAQLTRINKSLLAEIGERKRSEQRLRSAQNKMRAMASEILFADERSRQHFATDLHDSVVQTLGAAKMRSYLIQESIPPELMPVFKELQEMISQSINQSRSIMSEMSPPILYELGLVPALEWLIEQIEVQHGLPINLETTAKASQPMEHEIQVLLFQATRELLMNVIKHSKAESASVRLSGSGSRVRIEVIDNGTGFDKKQAFRTDISSGGFGLFSIRERLRHLGGKLIIQSIPGQGTRVIMTAPMSMRP